MARAPLVFIGLLLMTSTSRRPFLSVNAQAHLLAGLSIATEEPATEAIERLPEWQAGVKGSLARFADQETVVGPDGPFQNLLSKTHAEEIREFSRSALPEVSRNAEHVLYPFGGPDFPYPSLFFPNMRELVLIGLENVGGLPDVESLVREEHLAETMVNLGQAFLSLPERSYFVTRDMQRTLREFGVTAVLAVGLALHQNRILEIRPTTIGEAPAVILKYTKPNDTEARVTYIQQDLSDAELSRSSEFRAYLRAARFDTLFYKAAQFLSFGSDFSFFNRLVLSEAQYVVQSDDGLPLKRFTEHPEAWRVRLFGMYAKPNENVFGNRVQRELLGADAAFVCKSGDRSRIHAFQEIWSDPQICSRPSHADGLEWGGFLPFPYGYGYRLTRVPTQLHSVTSNLIYAERRHMTPRQ